VVAQVDYFHEFLLDEGFVNQFIVEFTHLFKCTSLYKGGESYYPTRFLMVDGSISVYVYRITLCHVIHIPHTRSECDRRTFEARSLISLVDIDNESPQVGVHHYRCERISIVHVSILGLFCNNLPFNHHLMRVQGCMPCDSRCLFNEFA